MPKRKIDAIKIEGAGDSDLERSVRTYGIEFVEKEKLDADYGSDIEHARLNLGGKTYFVLMKRQLTHALSDPSGNDMDLLRTARDYLRRKLSQGYVKKELKPNVSALESTTGDRYLNSLLMKLVRFTTNEPDKEVMRQLGLFNRDIKKLYADAATAWCGEPADISLGGITSKVDKIEEYSGSATSIDLSVDRCESGSHYVLKLSLKKMQEKVQKKAPVISEEYLEIEKRIIGWVEQNAEEAIKNNAANLVRVFLNLSCLYSMGNPLPVK